MRNTYTTVVEKPEEKRQLGVPRRRWEDIRMNLIEIRKRNVDLIHLTT
jgi:hypothetical protein